MVSTSKSSSSAHAFMLQSSLANKILSSWQFLASVAPSAPKQITLRVRIPPPHFLLQSDHGPANHWTGHFSGPSHSRSFSGFSAASHLSSSTFLTTSFSNFPQITTLFWTPFPHKAEHLVHCDENHEKSQGGVALQGFESSGFSLSAQNFSS